MPFQMYDVTAGIPILYIDNSGNLGLGSLPTNDQAVTLGTNGLLSALAVFTSPIAVPGVPLANTGQIIIGPNTSGSVAIVYTEVPTVSSSTSPSGVTTSTITWTNVLTSDLTVTYGIW